MSDGESLHFHDATKRVDTEQAGRDGFDTLDVGYDMGPLEQIRHR